MQIIMIEGRLGRDAKLKESTSGQRFITFTVAVNSKVRGAEKTTWYEVISFNEMYFNWLEFLKKGSTIAVTGDFDFSIQDGSDGISRPRISVNAFKLDFPVSSNSGTTKDTQTTVVSNTATENETPAEEEKEPTKPKATKTAPKTKAPKNEEDSATETSDAEDLPF